MEIFDIFILAVLLSFAVIGFMRGVFKSLVVFLGFIIVIFLSYIFKNYIGDILVLNLPFISFGIGGVATLNVIMYQALSFLIMLIIFGLIYKFLVTITGIFEKLLRVTILLGIPSKLLGMVVGFLEGYVIIYLVLFFLTQPFIKIELVNSSKYAKIILNDTPVISSYAEKSLRTIDDVRRIIKMDNKEEMEKQMIELILRDKVTSPEVMQKLVDKKKIDVNGAQEIIDRYKEVK